MQLKQWEDIGIHDAFLIAVVLKGLDGLLEVVLGFILMFTDEVRDIVIFLTGYAIIGDPNNYIASHLHALANAPQEVYIIGGAYLIAHGILKSFIAGTLWRNYSWAYPAALIFLGAFILYEFIGIAERGSVPLMCLAVFDILMFALVGYEYKRSPHRA
jgi:uncharacterized membrane protein